MKYIVTKPFKDIDGVVKKEGEIVEVEGFRVAKLRRYGLIGAYRETATFKPPEKATLPEVKNMGGGWYEVSGEKVQGKKAAEKLLKEGDA